MQTTFMQRVLPQANRVDGLLADLSSLLGNGAWTTLRKWPRPLRERALSLGHRQPASVTLLVTDLVDFSSWVTSLGDLAAHKLMQSHNAMLRACLRQCTGREVTHTGDGIISSFHDPLAAAQCALLIQRCMREQRAREPGSPLRARIGLHAGRPLPEEGRLFGGCVNYAVRVCAAAASEEILVSNCVMEKIARQFDCLERPPVPLKGFKGLHRLHALRQPA